MADANGKTINNVVVGFDSAKTALTVTGATTSSKSFIQLLGSQDWGLTDVPVAFGSSSTYAKIDTDTLAGSNLYVTQDPVTDSGRRASIKQILMLETFLIGRQYSLDRVKSPLILRCASFSSSKI